MTKYQVIDSKEEHQQPIANILLRKDRHGNVDIVINSQSVAFFNQHGELWRMNFTPDSIGPLQRVGIRFERGKGMDEEFFVIKLGGE